MLENRRGAAVSVRMYAVLIGLTLLFLLSFFNRFVGLRSGDGEYVSGMALLSGLVPYRDYYTTAPPLNILKSAILLKTFGGALIVSRVAGVAERLLIAAIVFRWLARIFRPWHALAASVVTIVVSTGDRTDPIASYNHDAILFALMGGFAASLALDGGSERRTAGLAFLAGASSGLSLLTKQTVGLGSLVCVLAAGTVLLARTHGGRAARVWGAAFAAGCIIPIAAVTVWLWRMHVLGAFAQMLFISGPAAKAGHLTELLTREIMVAKGNRVWLSLAVIALTLSGRAIWRGLQAGDSPAGDASPARWVLVAGTVVIGTADALALTSLPALRDFSKSSVYYALLGLTAFLIPTCLGLVRRVPSPRVAQALLFAAVAWSISTTLSLSWPAFEAITLPGLGFLLAATLDGVRPRLQWFTLLVMAAMVFLQVREKLDMPFGFNHQDEAAVRFADNASHQPMLHGIRMPAATASFLDETVRIVQTESRPGDTIFTYPEMGLLYALTGRRPPTVALSQNIDVVNDAFARDEALRLTAAPPAIIVYYRQSEADLREDERIWRRGDRSGQRDLIAAVERLISGYRLAGNYAVAPGDPPIGVYVRP